ncbi:MAG TPA: hypothetical protein VHV78_17475, partial [Gemmatimonadaceae bacterium]|nr:hypothetical protein [Gemmatimonadaceae bacterium]
MTPRQNSARHARRHPASTRIAQAVGLTLIAVAVVVARRPASLAARGTDPTFADDVAPILYKNCTVCHHPGGIGPFSLIDYDSARANLDDIRDEVAAGQMPPWHAEGPRDVFRNDRRLSDSDKQTILRWIDAGAPAGDLASMPPRPQYDATWTMGTPDATVSMPEDFTVPATGTV